MARRRGPGGVFGKALGVDICEYFKADPETKSIVHVLVPSAYDSAGYTRPATDLYWRTRW